MRSLLTILSLIFSSFVFAETAVVSWDANSENDLAGYIIYYGTSSGSYTNEIDVGDTTQFIIEGLVAKTTYFWAVAAYDTAGNRSDLSEEVIFPDNREPNKWEIVFWNGGGNSEEIILEVVAHGDETFIDRGWTVWGHIDSNPPDAGLYILNPERLSVRVLFDAKIIGFGTCIDESRILNIESEFWNVDIVFQEIEFTSDSEIIFINFIGDCWIPNESDANLRIENIKIFK